MRLFILLTLTNAEETYHKIINMIIVFLMLWMMSKYLMLIAKLLKVYIILRLINIIHYVERDGIIILLHNIVQKKVLFQEVILNTLFMLHQLQNIIIIMDSLNIVIKMYYHTRKSKNILMQKRKNIKMITEKQ
jgi:hypothetical protein